MTYLNKITEVVGTFNDYDQMEDTINKLEVAGIERRHISVLGSEEAVKNAFGTSNVPTEYLEDNPQTPRSIDVRREELGLGQGVLIVSTIILGAITAMAINGDATSDSFFTHSLIGGIFGSAIGVMLAKFLNDKFNEFFEHQIENGGIPLWVNIENKAQEKIAKNILRAQGAWNVHTHELKLDSNDYAYA